MKVFQTVSSLLLLVILAVVDNAQSLNPDCKLSAVAGYQNCRSEFYVNQPSASALWCTTEEACEAILGVDEAADLTGSTARVSPPERDEEMEVSAVEEQVMSSSSMLRTATTAVLAMAVSAMMIAC